MNVKKNKNLFRGLVLICLIALVLCGCGKGVEYGLEQNIKELASSVLEETPEASVGSVNGEWAVLGLSRSGYNVPDDYFDIYYDNVRAYVKSNKGILSEDTYTEYSRVVLALAEIGKGPKDVEGYDIVSPLNDFDKVIEQGINGPAYALIAADSAGIKLKKEQDYIDYILKNELTSGGYSFSKKFDAGITAMVIQALAPYSNKEMVAETIDRSFDALGRAQNEDGTFEGGSETAGQVILALCSMGRDPLTDEQFIKNNNSIYDTLMSYKVDGGLAHEKGEGKNVMATEQGLYAVTAIKLNE